ncbi:hypothetical protein D0860_05753 [Hortaea werneckii]|uniref:Dolichyl-diphosphooligosaccharide--protein glycosyltransferase subunit OST2 n=1 Tax=Hortaea werneckii TaxID=91943 RepID=A0A3M7GYU3_HORWE|nr:hypothetical protein D0860_05753 [Hortaea werneckii]RMZ27641.1 hypothetical protein D0859_08283 [Hortaea werneckii]
MAPKKGSPAPAAVPASAAKPTTSVSSAAGQPTKPANKPAAANTPNSIKNAQDVQQIGFAVWNNYMDTTPQRVKLLDSFMAFLIVVAGIQFLYCLIAGNFRGLDNYRLVDNADTASKPFNAFLSGFSATIGQFVLTASLRIQTNPQNTGEFGTISHERAFADFVFGSMILHFFCVNFIN